MLALTSASLLIASFPNVNQPWCAWVALAPWLWALRRLNARQAFGWSWLTGFVFFLGSIRWLIHVTLIGWLLLCAYLGLYFGAFGWLVRQFQGATFVHRPPWPVIHQSRPPRLLQRTGQPLACSFVLVPSAWVALEYLRSHLLTGFGWNLLAYSQTSCRHLIQIADVTGAWGVSFAIVLVNAAFEQSLRQQQSAASGRKTQDSGSSGLRILHPASCILVVIPAAMVLAMLGYGAWRIPRVMGPQTVRVAVVQGNIPQTEKWDESRRESILNRYESLTREAADSHPDLIVWPETSVPGFLDLDEPLTQRILGLSQSLDAPLLVGAPRSHLEQLEWRTTNGAALVHRGAIVRWYDKLHLVPFGEFIPLDRQWPWLRRALPPIGDFVPGREYAVFQLRDRLKAEGSRPKADNITASSLQPPASSAPQASLQPSASHLQLPFSVLICFEDLFPELARRFVLNGAELLLVITNDAWFGPTAAAYQHAQASSFRAVELHVPVVRAANTGWSGCIDASGRWLGGVHDAAGKELFVSGIHTCDLSKGAGGSLYLRWGDWFAWVCLAVTLVSIGCRAIKVRDVRQRT